MRWSLACATALLVLFGLPDARGDDAPEALSAFPRTLLSIKTARTVQTFDAWIANSPRRQQQGLMFVRELDAHRAMAFVYPDERRITMWMKNTFIPLDMLFVDARGKIVFIAHDATPRSLDIVASPIPAKAVFELAGGIARRFGISLGDEILCACLESAR